MFVFTGISHFYQEWIAAVEQWKKCEQSRISQGMKQYFEDNGFEIHCTDANDHNSIFAAVLQQLQYSDDEPDLNVTNVSDLKQLVLDWLDEHNGLNKYKRNSSRSWATIYGSNGESEDALRPLIIIACAHIFQCSIHVHGPTEVNDAFWIKVDPMGPPSSAPRKSKATLRLMFFEDKFWSIAYQIGQVILQCSTCPLLCRMLSPQTFSSCHIISRAPEVQYLNILKQCNPKP